MALSYIRPLLAKQQGGLAHSLVRHVAEFRNALLNSDSGISKP